MMIKNCKNCGKDFESELNLNQYCTTKCKSQDKFFKIQGKGKSFKVWKKNYEKYPEFYNSLSSYKDRYKNKCFICEKEYEKFSMCCSESCSSIMKKQSTFLSTGSNHNLSKDSLARKNMIKSLNQKYGVDNVFARNDVLYKLKETWVQKYGYTNPSKVDQIKNKKRATAEKNGFWAPKEKMDLKSIYDENVHNITWSQMRRYAKIKFGDDIWEKISESRKLKQSEWLTVDHRYSRSFGFKHKISPEIIGHICNLEIINFSDNAKKNSSCSIKINELIKEIQEFDSIVYKK